MSATEQDWCVACGRGVLDECDSCGRLFEDPVCEGCGYFTDGCECEPLVLRASG